MSGHGGHNHLVSFASVQFVLEEFVKVQNTIQSLVAEIPVDNLGVGKSALNRLVTGSSNVAVGPRALSTVSSGFSNTAVGVDALGIVTDGVINTAMGVNALGVLTVGDRNTAMGVDTLAALINGDNNTAMGYQALLAITGTNSNTAIGHRAMVNSVNASTNVAVGQAALEDNVSGDDNVVIGVSAMGSNISGIRNVAVGSSALFTNTAGNSNVAIGRNALFSATGGSNTVVGADAGDSITTGTNNVAVGGNALDSVVNASNNIAIGQNAGSALTGTDSTNICIGHVGVSGDGLTTRIGTSQTTNFQAGIRGVTTGVADATAVLIDSAGQLGQVSSSERYKRDIETLDGKAIEDVVMAMRPVKFHFNAHQDGPWEYGFIAEEFGDVFPDAVVCDLKGRPDALQYHKLDALCVSMLQTRQAALQNQQAEIMELKNMLQNIL